MCLVYIMLSPKRKAITSWYLIPIYYYTPIEKISLGSLTNRVVLCSPTYMIPRPFFPGLYTAAILIDLKNTYLLNRQRKMNIMIDIILLNLCSTNILWAEFDPYIYILLYYLRASFSIILNCRLLTTWIDFYLSTI